MRVHPLLLVVLLVACLPQRHSLLGKSCDAGDECAADQLLCIDFRCVPPDGGPGPAGGSGGGGGAGGGGTGGGADGALTYLSCVFGGGTNPGGCTLAAGLGGVQRLAMSRDGRHLYALSSAADALAVFQRDATTGALSQLPADAGGCYTRDGAGCGALPLLDQPFAVAVAPDDRHLYVAALGSQSVSGYARAPGTGALTALPLSCLQSPLLSTCANHSSAVLDVRDLDVAADGTQVYAAAGANDTLAVLGREPASGALALQQCFAPRATDAGCAIADGLNHVYATTSAPDGRRVFAAGYFGNHVSAFSRDDAGVLSWRNCVGAASGACQPTPFVFDHGRAMVATPRGVYVAVEGSVDPRNSAVAFLAAGPTGLDPDAGCVGTDAGRCGTFAAALRGPQGLALSPDGKNLYVTTADDDAVLTLSLGADGAPRFVSCVQSMDAPSARRECAAFAPGLNAAQGVVVSPDGRFVYVAAEASRAISVFSRR